MKRIVSFLAGLVGLAVVLIALAGLVYGVIEDPAVVGPLTAAAVVLALAIYQRRWEKSQELERIHREQMMPTYTALAETVKNIDVFAAKPRGPIARGMPPVLKGSPCTSADTRTLR